MTWDAFPAVFGFGRMSRIIRERRGAPLRHGGILVGRERSRCDSCGTILTSQDLIPILSFLLRKGKCRHCGAAIGVRYFAVELIGASITGRSFSDGGVLRRCRSH
jgi:prepilin signal peptidase PulO-like enzyme (type II secretory pathway)